MSHSFAPEKSPVHFQTTGILTDRLAGRQAGRKACRQANRQMDGQTDGLTDRQTDWLTDRQTNRYAIRNADRQSIGLWMSSIKPRSLQQLLPLYLIVSFKYEALWMPLLWHWTRFEIWKLYHHWFDPKIYVINLVNKIHNTWNCVASVSTLSIKVHL
jgi:hypothetical protein